MVKSLGPLVSCSPFPSGELPFCEDQGATVAPGLYSHVYSHRVGMSRDEAGRAGTMNSDNVREHSKSLGFSKADSHLENRWSRKAPKGSNPFPSARNGHFPRATVGRRSPIDRSSDRIQRAATSTGLVKSAGAWVDVTGPGPRVCPGVAAPGRGERSTHAAATRRPLATMLARVARRGWAEWVEP